MTRLAHVTWMIPLLAGCGGVVIAGPPASSQALVTYNGKMQNGKMQNGKMQNGKMQNGVPLALAGVDLGTMKRLIVAPAAGQDPDVSDANLVAVPNVTLNKTILSDGTRSGTAFQGYVVDGSVTADGKTMYPARIYIESITATADPDILHYVLKAHHLFISYPACVPSATDDCMIWDYVCGTVEQQLVFQFDQTRSGAASPELTVQVPTPAIAVSGQWDYQQGAVGNGSKIIERFSPQYNTLVTFACTDGAIGKCVEKAGYKPWAPAPTECSGSVAAGTYHCLQTTQEMLHEACVRMVRADYCGDGVSHTVDGMALDIYDAPGINHETPYGPTDGPNSVPYGHEAEWTPKGARCLSQLLMTRIAGGRFAGTVKQYLETYCPAKWPTDENGVAFSWLDQDCFGIDSSFYYSNVPWGRVATGRIITTMDMHDRVWLRNKSVCVDDSYDHTATSNPTLASPSTPYSRDASNYNTDRYAQQWCGVCLKDPNQPTVCGISSSAN